ncbi:uncharacterized protein LOC111865732 isoform X3 [Cryptotermes secundus]|uniref:uncharacterized protein LOC111865732 isoform X3 n=1 Tax=Cryptotermes secundus TaxID=105785 RepID=UPI000CD7D219|nr:uncharacterized protein LOC111865732 isoform X3 [Cryptotermes secundus]
MEDEVQIFERRFCLKDNRAVMVLGKHNPDERNVMTVYLSEDLGAVSREFQTRSFHANSVGIDDSSSAVEGTIEESKSSDEKKGKKRFSSAGHNKPPELVPYCSDVHVSHPDEDSSSPPHLFPEGIMTTKLKKSLPGKTVKDIQLISIGSSSPQNKDDMECTEFNDSSEFECDEEYVIAEKLKRKINPLCKSLGLSPLKQGKWMNEVKTDNRHTGIEKSVYNFFLNMKLGKTRLRERDKLRKASERMRRSPRALTSKDENTDTSSVLQGKCGADVNTARTETCETSTAGSNITKYSESPSHLDNEYNRTVSQKKSFTALKGGNYSPLTQSSESYRMNFTECIDISGESVDSFESMDAEGELGGYLVNEVALSEPTVKQQCTERNEACRNFKESWFSLSSKNGSTELHHNLLACNVIEDAKKDTKQVAEEVYSLSKKAQNYSNASIPNKCDKEQDSISVCIKSSSDSQNSKGQNLKGVQDKLKVTQKRVLTSEQTELTGLFQKRVSSLQNFVQSGGDEKECGTTENAKSTAHGSNKVAESSSYYCKGNTACDTEVYASDEIAACELNEELKKDGTVIQGHNAEFTTSAVSESNRMKQCCRKQEGNIYECDSCESNTQEVKKKQQNIKLQTADCSLLEGHKKVFSRKGSLGLTEMKINKCEDFKEGMPKTSESDLITCKQTVKGDKRETSCVMVAGSSSDSIFTYGMGNSNFNGTSKLNSSHSSEKGVNYQSDVTCARMMVDSFGRDLLAGCDVAQEPPDDIDPNVYVTQDPNKWPVVEGDEDYDDYIFTLPKRVSTGKEERDIIDGIEMLSFETEHDMVEFTKIQQDFCHGSSVDDGMIQSDDGLDMMDDTFPLCGDVDLQYMHQAIVPTKTNDITKIKGWRNKQFAVNDNPSHYCGSFSSEAYEDDDGFESCDVKTTDETNTEEDQQNHWYSEDTKYNDTDVCTTVKDAESRATEARTSSGSCGKQKPNLVKEDVMLSYGAVFQPKAVELLKHLQANVSETNNSKSAFVSDVLDNYLSTHSQLNVSYEIPKLGAEEGITHHPEYETDKFIFPSPPKLLHTVSEKPCVPRKTGPKPKTLAEKRKMLEMEMLEAESIKGQKRPQRGRPRLRPQTESVAPTKCTKNSDTKKPSTVKWLPSTPQKKGLEQNSFILDHDYKYTWIGKRPIRITGSKVNREPALNEGFLSLSAQSEMQQDPSDITQKESEAVSDTKSCDETSEQNITVNDLTTSEKLPPSPPDISADPYEYGVLVYPGIGHPLHPLAVKQLMQMRSTEVCIDRKWAEFSVSVVTSRKNINNHDHTETHVIPVKCIPPFKDFKISPHKEDEVSPSHSESALLNTEIPKDSDSSFSSFKRIQISPETELFKQNPKIINADSLVTVAETDLEATCVDPGSSKADENVSSTLSFVPCDEVLLEVKNILKEMIDCVLVHEVEDTVIQDDPDESSTVTMITPKCQKKVIGKYMKNKVYRELNRLDVNVIVMGEDRNGCIEKIYGGTSCEKDFCRLGCVCASLQTSQPSATLSNHCGNLECMFECSCQELSTTQSNSNSNAEKPSLLYCTAIRLQDEENRHLAKVEKEFRHTVIQSKNEVIVIRGSSSGDGGRRRREIKLPERYRDSSVVLGKEFAMAEFKMITGEDINSTPAVSSNHNTRRSERQLYLPNYIEVGVPKSASMSITKPLHKSTKGKLTLEQKVSLWCKRFKVKPCRVRIEKTEGLENVVPWCMVHLRYDCFCFRQSAKSFMRMPYQSIERPPPVPGPPLDSTATNVDFVKHQNRVSRNVAVKSTSQANFYHAHNVNCHSARTVGSTINYVLRNQSHFFKWRHERIGLQESETKCNVNNAFCAPFQMTEPVNIIRPPGDIVMQADCGLLNEQEMMPIDSDTGDGNEEVGFGKIVSIVSLKPEEFEKCGSEDQTEHEAEGSCNMDMVLNTEGQLTGVLSAERNVSEENSNVTKSKTQRHSSDNSEHHSEENSCENQIYEKLASVLIPVFPDTGHDIYSVRLAELISRKDSELRNIVESCNMPLNLSQSTTGSIQVIGWNILINQIENRTYHLWLQYKRACVPKIIITGTADKPDQYCISLCNFYSDSPPQFHNKLPPFITFLIEQLSIKNRTPGVSSEDVNCFGLLQFDGDRWELIGSFMRNTHIVEWCSNQLVQSHTAKQARHQKASARHQQDQKFSKSSQKGRSEDIAEKQSYIIEEQEIRKETKFHEDSRNDNINMNTVASFSPPLTDLWKHQDGVGSSQESVVESSQTVQEATVEQHIQIRKSHTHPDLPLKEQNLFFDRPVVCGSTDVLLDLKKRLGPQLVQSHSVGTIGAGADLTNTDKVSSEDVIAVCDSKLTSDSARNNGKTVKNDADQKSVTTNAYSAGRESVLVHESPVSRKNFSLHSESECGNCDLKVIDSQGQIQSSDLKDGGCEEITVIGPKQKSFISEKTEVTTNQQSILEQSLTSRIGTLSVRLSNNSCNSGKIQSSGVEVPLPTGCDPARWYMLNIRNRFDLLHLSRSKCIIRYAQLIRAVYLANSHGKTVRVPLEKRLSKGIDGKNTSVSSDKHQIASATQPKFGVYTVPNLYTRVFIGPYGLREDAGVGAIKIINGRLVNTMYLDPQHDSLADTDEGITALLESGGNEAVLNMKMEQMYDSVARAPEDGRMCRGMWLYTARSEDKASTAVNVKTSLINITGNRVSSASTRSSTSASVTEIGDEEQNTATDMEKSHTFLCEEKFHTEMKDSKSCSESEDAAQHSVGDDVGTDLRRMVSRRKQSFSVQNVAHVTHQNISVHETPKNVGKECDIEEGEVKQQSSKHSPLLAVTEPDSTCIRDLLSSAKSDSDIDVVDMDTSSSTGKLLHRTCMLPGAKGVDCKGSGENEDSSLQQHQKQIFPEPTDNAASSTTPVCSAVSVHSASPLVKDTFKPPLLARPTYPQGSTVMSVGKTIVSVKLVPSIPRVGYIKAVMYHNKSVMLKDPFSSMDEQAYFQNLETATRWLTDELKKRIQFIPEHLKLIWRIKHATVNIKTCQLFDCKILDGNHILTEKGVFEQKAKPAVTHATNEKMRRQELFDSFQVLRSTLLPKELHRKTKRFDILKLAVDEIKCIHAMNTRLQSQLEVLQKRRLTNCAKLYQKLKALPSVKDRKKEVANLRKIFENYDEKVPIINLHETTSDADEESVTELQRKAVGSSHHAENAQHSHMFDRANGNTDDSNDCVTDGKDKEDSTNIVKPWVGYPLKPKKGMDDDFVSVSISVVQDDGPAPVASEREDKDVVTVTRIPQGSGKEKPLQDPISSAHKSCISSDEGVIQSKFTASGEKQIPDEIITVLDTSQVIPVKTDICERQVDHTVKKRVFPSLPGSSEKEVNCMLPEKSAPISLLKKSTDASIEFIEPPNMQGKIKTEGTKRKAEFGSIVVNEPQKPTLKSLDVKDTVPNSGEKRSNCDEETDTGGRVPSLDVICYTVMPSQRKRTPVCVDNKRTGACTSLGVRLAANIEAADPVIDNLQKFKLKQQRFDVSSSGNIILTSNENNVDSSPSKNVQINEVNRSLQNHVKDANIREKNAIKNLFSDLPKVVSVNETDSISSPSLKKDVHQGRSSDFKYAYDNSTSRLVPATVSSGNKVGYHIVTNSQCGRSGNALSCSNVAMKTAVGQNETLTPVFVAVVSSASTYAAGTTNSISAPKVNIVAAVSSASTYAHAAETTNSISAPKVNIVAAVSSASTYALAAETTNSISAPKVNIVAAVGSSNLQTNQTGPQFASGVGSSPGHTVHLLQPLTTRRLCVSGNKLLSFQRNKNNQYMLCSGNQMYAAHLLPAPVPTQKSPSSVVTKYTDSSSSINKDSVPLLTVPRPNTNLIVNCPPLVKHSVSNPPQSSELSTNSANHNIKIKHLLPNACPTFIPDKLRTPSHNVISVNDVHTTTNVPGLTLMTHTTHTNSTASRTLTPDVVNTTQSKPIVSVRNSNSYATTIIPKRLESSPSSPAFISLARKLPSATFESVKKDPTVCLRTVASNNAVSKLMTTHTKSVEPRSVNMKVTSPVATRKIFMLDVRLKVPCSSNRVSSGNGVGKEKSEISQNDCVSSVRILREKSENDISSPKDSDEKSQDESVSGDTTSDKKSPYEISGIISNEKSHKDNSRVRTPKQKLQHNRISCTRSSGRTTHKSAVPSPKQDCHTTSSRESRAKAREDTRSMARKKVRSGSKAKMTKAPVEMMVTRSSSRKKWMYGRKSCT